ncbi:recombinase family protein [Luteibacter sp. 3190]|uniref:recombinase family protein n=1 Tax=Luteibacter sp. 3190 TaxID=2817736 RepID=UPI002864B758|nr:recombinase family protein [Luteibacter sp. 3190]MDR6935321.1 DNA invertase Pin-like site-specific DNA recombinase [Luteibacter sp. 3190]
MRTRSNHLRVDASAIVRNRNHEASSFVTDVRVVRTFSDEGLSGLTAEQRPGLLALLRAIAHGPAGFEAVLVLDVSRWGRFQNTDEAAYYEFVCWKAGVQVIYVAEPFANDLSPFSMVVKGLKRVMAAEYSRELSAKVLAGQRRIAEMGYRAGGIAGYGLRRMLIDKDGDFDEARFRGSLIGAKAVETGLDDIAAMAQVVATTLGAPGTDPDKSYGGAMLRLQ